MLDFIISKKDYPNITSLFISRIDNINNLKELERDQLFLITVFTIYKSILYKYLYLFNINKLVIDIKDPIAHILNNIRIRMEIDDMFIGPNANVSQLCNVIEYGAPMGINQTVATGLFNKMNIELTEMYKILLKSYKEYI